MTIWSDFLKVWVYFILQIVTFWFLVSSWGSLIIKEKEELSALINLRTSRWLPWNVGLRVGYPLLQWSNLVEEIWWWVRALPATSVNTLFRQRPSLLFGSMLKQMSLNLIIPCKIQKLEIMYKASFEMVLLIIMRGEAVEQRERRSLPSVGLVGKRRGMGDRELGCSWVLHSPSMWSETCVMPCYWCVSPQKNSCEV